MYMMGALMYDLTTGGQLYIYIYSPPIYTHKQKYLLDLNKEHNTQHQGFRFFKLRFRFKSSPVNQIYACWFINLLSVVPLVGSSQF